MRLIERARSLCNPKLNELTCPHWDLTGCTALLDTAHEATGQAKKPESNLVLRPSFDIFTFELPKMLVLCENIEIEDLSAVSKVEGVPFCPTHFYACRTFMFQAFDEYPQPVLFGLSPCSVLYFNDDYTQWQHAGCRLHKSFSFCEPYIEVYGGKLTDEGRQGLETVLLKASTAVVKLAALLNCKGIESETVTPTKQEKKKARRGRRPEPMDYNILRLSTKNLASVKAAAGKGGDMRRHIVRGHIRRLPPGCKKPQTWVAPHMRGSTGTPITMTKVLP